MRDGARDGEDDGESERRRLAGIVEYYAGATPDYARWSPGLHMHFGCWAWPLSPFNREAMLAGLSERVHGQLGLAAGARGRVLDLGCGVGSSARLLAHARPQLQVLGLTLSPRQVELGTELNAAAGLAGRVELRRADYRDTGLEPAAALGAYAIESACYDPEDGRGLVREAARVLAPGARLVVADAFRRRSLPRAAARCEAGMAAGWQLPGLSDRQRFEDALTAHGFEIEAVDDISWRVGPSVAHIPFAVAAHRLRLGTTLTRHHRAHLRASLWCLACAVLWPRRFGYFVVTARRR